MKLDCTVLQDITPMLMIVLDLILIPLGHKSPDSNPNAPKHLPGIGLIVGLFISKFGVHDKWVMPAYTRSIQFLVGRFDTNLRGISYYLLWQQH